MVQVDPGRSPAWLGFGVRSGALASPHPADTEDDDAKNCTQGLLVTKPWILSNPQAGKDRELSEDIRQQGYQEDQQSAKHKRACS